MGDGYIPGKQSAPLTALRATSPYEGEESGDAAPLFPPLTGEGAKRSEAGGVGNIRENAGLQTP